ncbi:VCBS repeat-containing protein [Rubripirellula sp.]|nr:VCBS repeat-containing protein [Rubripirellula sp.]
MRVCLALSSLAICVFAIDASAQNTDLKFKAKLLHLDANEGIACGDLDGDGIKDLVAGRNWYKGGDWAPRPLRSIEDWNGYVQSNGDYLFDVNGDGRLDVIAGSFIPTEVHWYENPGEEALRLGKQWTQHLLVDTGNTCNEGQVMQDVDGDGRPEWLVNSWKKNVPAVIWRLVDREKPAENGAKFDLVPHQIGDKGNGHGMAIGDISGDGRADLLVGQGWYEQPESDSWGQPWDFHPDWDMHASVPMIVVDLDQDGDGDLIHGKGHDYGLLWWENQGPDADGKMQWAEHEIDKSYSQPHTLAWSDITGDNQPELITGKRYFGHNGRDPGGMEMPCLYFYQWDPKTKSFHRQTIEEGHVGCGLQIVTTDLNQDSKIDIAVAGKSGTYLLLAE